MDYKAVIFDFDYTLGDATDAIFAGFRHGFSVMGYPEPDRETVRHTVGMLLEDAYTQLTGDATEQGRAAFRAQFSSVARPMQAAGTPLCEGAEALLHALRAAGVATAVVSTKHTETLESIFAQHGLLDVFSFVIGGDKVRRPKPGIPSSTPGPRTTPGRISARSSTGRRRPPPLRRFPTSISRRTCPT